jgi:hypothetical protein
MTTIEMMHVDIPTEKNIHHIQMPSRDPDHLELIATSKVGREDQALHPNLILLRI